MTKDLLPCPFCGGEAGFHAVAGRTYAECKQCEASSALIKTGNNNDLSKVVKAWNTRVTSPVHNNSKTKPYYSDDGHTYCGKCLTYVRKESKMCATCGALVDWTIEG